MITQFNKIIAIIPAREGSKGLQNKNILKLNNKPLFLWPVLSAIKSKIFNKIIITTDIPKILDMKIDNVIIHKRSKKLSTDKSESYDFIVDVLNNYCSDEETFCLLEPTSPFTSSTDIKNSYSLLKKNKKAKSIVSVMENDKFHPDYNFTINKNKFILSKKKYIHKRRQDLNKFFCLDGSIYMSDIKHYIKKKSFVSNETISIFFEKFKNIEIDDYYDYEYAKMIAKNINENKIL